MTNPQEIHFVDQMQALVDRHLDGFIETVREGVRAERAGHVDPAVNLKGMAEVFAEIDTKLGAGYMTACAVRRLALIAEGAEK